MRESNNEALTPRGSSLAAVCPPWPVLAYRRVLVLPAADATRRRIVFMLLCFNWLVTTELLVKLRLWRLKSGT